LDQFQKKLARQRFCGRGRIKSRGNEINIFLFWLGVMNWVLGFLRATCHLPRVARGTARPKLRSGGQDTKGMRR